MAWHVATLCSVAVEGGPGDLKYSFAMLALRTANLQLRLRVQPARVVANDASSRVDMEAQ